MTNPDHCCNDCCDNPEHDHYYKKENIIKDKEED
mgnify:FL=1|jgi:hypothetical protein|tara:strand:- start:720 stop:821 length:102 start_codon:yes stop_codon:yes gene_type:complete